MTKKLQIYKCDTCGNVVEVVGTGEGELVCCGHAMNNMVENTQDAAKEKHVPVLEKTDGGFVVKVGSVNHPMEDKHYIEWIELVTDKKVYRQELAPHDEPKAEFKTDASSLSARAYCNLHGLWKGDI
jgi:superoxide reductase